MYLSHILNFAQICDRFTWICQVISNSNHKFSLYSQKTRISVVSVNCDHRIFPIHGYCTKDGMGSAKSEELRGHHSSSND